VTSERDAWLALASAPGVGPRTAQALVRAFGSVVAAVEAPFAEVARRPRPLGRRVAEALAGADPRALDEAARAAGQACLTPADPGYPPALLQTPDPPLALFVRGRLPASDVPWAAVVGTRSASRYGLRVARALAHDLARAGVVVASGLARGIDGAAHEGALAGGGETVAALGCGADHAYPPEHEDLLREVAAHGAAVTEHAPGVEPRREHFPRRNRLIAGLVRALVVVEAPRTSGALLTAQLALEGGVEVLAVPGPVDRGTHEGCHRLLRTGAGVCEGGDDVLVALRLRAPGGRGPVAASEAGPRAPAARPPPGPPLVVHGALDRDDALDVDEISARTALGPDEVAAALTVLELRGLAQRVPGVGYVRPS
jgi:DNA processing protein